MESKFLTLLRKTDINSACCYAVINLSTTMYGKLSTIS